MNSNFGSKISRFIKNKNTVTIVGVCVVLALLYFGYSKQVKTSVNPVAIPVANGTIQPRTQITASMIKTISVPSIAVVDNVYRNANAIIGMYTNVNTIVPDGSMFYKQALITKSQLPDSAFFDIEEDQIPYMFNVNLQSTYGNSIYPGSKIDIYMKATNEENKVMFGKLFSDVYVVAVKDSQGNDVFENSEENRSPAYLIFGLSEEFHLLLRKSNYLPGVELIPVPHGGVVASEGEMRVSTETLRDYITSKTVVLEGQEGTSSEIEDKKDDAKKE